MIEQMIKEMIDEDMRNSRADMAEENPDKVLPKKDDKAPEAPSTNGTKPPTDSKNSTSNADTKKNSGMTNGVNIGFTVASIASATLYGYLFSL